MSDAPEPREWPPRVELTAAERRRAHASLVADMRLALLSEIGARAIYDHLARHVRDEVLRGVLVQLNHEGAEAVERLQGVIASLGARPKRTSLRRRALARVLALSSRVIGVRPVLRICLHAEQTVARWYSAYAHFLLRMGDEEPARTCGELERLKLRHAQVLGAWIQNARSR